MGDPREVTLEALSSDSAVQAITRLALAGHPAIKTDSPAVVLPEGSKVESLEYLADAPKRLRATYTTERISDFCRYVEAEGKNDTVVFVQSDGAGALAIIDYGIHELPGWGEHRAVLKMQHTPEFTALKRAAQRALDQRSLVEFLEDWRHIIRPYSIDDDVASEMPMHQAIARIRRIDVKKLLDRGHEESDWGAKKSTFASIEATSGQDKPPAGLWFQCKPFADCQAREIDVRLSIHTADEDPKLRMRLVGETALERDIAEEIELDITERLNGLRVFIGTARTAYE